MEPRLSKVTSR